MEFMDDFTGKLYHHKMKCIQLNDGIDTKDMIKYLRKRHEKYLEFIIDDQLIDLISILRKKIKKNNDVFTNPISNSSGKKIQFSP